MFSDSAMTIKYQYLTCFIQRTGNLSKSDHVCESCHEQRRLLRTLEKELMLLITTSTPQIHSQTDCVQMEEIQDHCYLPEKWSTSESDKRSLQSRTCNSPRVTSKQLKAFLTLANVNVHEPTIRRTLSNHGVHGRVARRKATVLQKENAC